MGRGTEADSSRATASGSATAPRVLVGARLTHQRASLDQLEAATRGETAERLNELLDREGVSEAAILRTCNRAEEYVVAETATTGREALADFGDAVPGATPITMTHAESLEHLLRVAAGLESQVLGEDQILGQVREAYAASKAADGLGPVLSDAFLKAIHVGERARSETAINEGIVSLGSAAVDLADRQQGLDGHVVVIGAGDVAGTVVSALADRQVDHLTVLNRSADRAAELAAEVGADHDDLDRRADYLREADVVLVSTGSASPVVGRAALEGAGETLVVDLGNPRDVAPDARELASVTAYDIDDLRAVTRRTHEERREAAEAVERIVEEEYDRLVESYKRKRADAVISGMYRGAERIKEAELSRAFSKLEDLDAEDREVVRAMADAIVSRMLAVPTESLRDAAAEDDLETLLAAIELFDPGVDSERQREMLTQVAERFVDAGPTEGASVGEGSED